MEKYIKIAVLDNTIQAQLIVSILNEQHIPHRIRSFYDTAYDGLFQVQKGWGELFAPAAFKPEILEIIKEIQMNDHSGTLKGTPFNLEQYVEYADGSVVSKTLLKKEIGNITLFAFDRDQGLSEHTAPFDAVVYILDGEAEITIGGQSQDVHAGEMLIMPANIAHALQAKTPFKMLLIMIRG
jgi:quercetin dioxygenase-like cupin family protein